jgi:hypothetical protein
MSRLIIEVIHGAFAVKKRRGEKSDFSCVGEEFALDRCLLMGDPEWTPVWG